MKPKAVARMLFAMVAVALLLPQTAAAVTHIVTVGDNFFNPSNLTIQVGDTVEWRNAAGGNSHNVVANNGSFNSGSPTSSFTFSETFNSAGTFNYGCTVHSNMDGTITVQSGGGGSADLAVQSVDAENGTYAPGDNISVDISIENIGNAASAAYTVTVYASTNSTINASDTEIGSSARSALSAGQTSNFSVNASFPDDIGDGSYFIGAIVEISDANNANNDGVDSTQVVVESPPAAELELNEVSVAPGSYPQGSAISINAEVQNTGNDSSGAFSIDYYASTNSGITVQDRLIGTENRASLPAGENSGGPFNATIPANLSPGSYFIGAIVDFGDSNTSNNINVEETPITVTASGGDGFEINYGLNDTWFNPATNGQGFFITVFPDIGKMFLAWFTYDVERPPGSVTAQLGDPGHRWLTAFGDYSGDTATLDIEITKGGVFDSPTPVPTQGPDGTITVTFTGCNAGEVSYNIPSVAKSGVVPIERIALDNVPPCEAQQTP